MMKKRSKWCGVEGELQAYFVGKHYPTVTVHSTEMHPRRRLPLIRMHMASEPAHLPQQQTCFTPLSTDPRPLRAKVKLLHLPIEPALQTRLAHFPTAFSVATLDPSGPRQSGK